MSEDTGDISLWRRLRLTPLRDLARGRVTGRLDWRTRIDEADLPEAAKQVVRRVVKKTRLWRLEKADVTEELIAHFEDGLEAAGEDTRTFATAQERRGDGSHQTLVEELIAEFGDEKRAAKLIRRAKKRNRPILWKMMKRLLQVVGVLIVIYAAAVGWFAMGSPDISVNYLAKLNAPAKAVPQEDRAWPIYRKALLKYGLRDMQPNPRPLFVEHRLIRPTDPQWPKAVAFLQQHGDLLALIRKGASKSGLGLEARFSPWAYSKRDRRALFEPGQLRNRPGGNPAPGTAWKSESLISALLPQLGLLRKMTWLMAADMHLAAVQGDADRIIADLDAIFGLANQSRELPNLISQLVAHSILKIGFTRFADVLAKHSTLFRDEQLVTVAHHLASLNGYRIPHLADNRLFMYDTFQRIYDKNGHVTDEGLSFLRVVSGYSGNPLAIMTEPAMPTVGLPLANVLIADRAEMTRQYERLMRMMEAYARLPLWEQLRQPSRYEQIMKRWRASPSLRLRYLPLMMLMPSVSAAGKTTHITIAIRDALEVAIALELYKREHHGAYPKTLAILVPRYLPEPPVDYSTGKPLLYKVVDGHPLLYGRGLDGDDDGGVREKEPKYGGWPRVPKQGDWVLYPRVGS